jgi:hypothetical protein
MLDRRHLVVRPEHVLVQEIAQRQVLGMVADRHHGDDLLTVQEQGERALVHDRRLHRPSFLVDAGHRLGEPRIVGLGQEQRRAHGGHFAA